MHQLGERPVTSGARKGARRKRWGCDPAPGEWSSREGARGGAGRLRNPGPYGTGPWACGSLEQHQCLRARRRGRGGPAEGGARALRDEPPVGPRPRHVGPRPGRSRSDRWLVGGSVARSSDADSCARRWEGRQQPAHLRRPERSPAPRSVGPRTYGPQAPGAVQTRSHSGTRNLCESGVRAMHEDWNHPLPPSRTSSGRRLCMLLPGIGGLAPGATPAGWRLWDGSGCAAFCRDAQPQVAGCSGSV